MQCTAGILILGLIFVLAWENCQLFVGIMQGNYAFWETMKWEMHEERGDNDKKEFLEKFNLNGSTPITLFINDGKETSILNRIEGETSKSKAVSKFKKMGFIN